MRPLSSTLLFSLIIKFLLFSAFFIFTTYSSTSNRQCYEYPNPTNRTHKVPIKCPIIKQTTINHLSTNSEVNSTNMFVVAFTCDAKSQTLCSKVKDAFDRAGTIITSILTLNTQIYVNASFVDFCTALGQCRGSTGLITLGKF